jgi:hypothetical protein
VLVQIVLVQIELVQIVLVQLVLGSANASREIDGGQDGEDIGLRRTATRSSNRVKTN